MNRLIQRGRYLPAALMLILMECSLAAEVEITREPLDLTARPVVLNETDPDAARLGTLSYRGGLVLDAGHPAFGGLSGLWAAPDGGRILAVTDRGHWVAAELAYDDRGWLSGVGGGEIGNLGLPAEGPTGDARGRDSEALTRLPDGQFLVSFEGQHRILRYPAGGTTPPIDQPGQVVALPDALREAPVNGGVEALAALADGRLVIFVEELLRADARAGFLRDENSWHRLRYPLHPDFKPTDAAQLPGGDLLVLERRFDPLGGFQGRLRRIAGDSLEPGARLDGPIIARFKPPVVTDNYEGLAVRQTEGGETRIYLVSDDNFQMLQRTLLLMFTLSEAES